MTNKIYIYIYKQSIKSMSFIFFLFLIYNERILNFKMNAIDISNFFKI